MPAFDLSACTRINTPAELPGDRAKCRAAKGILESIRDALALRFLPPRLPIPPRPPFRVDIFKGDPTPEPNVVGSLLNGELVLNALKHKHSPSSILGQIQASGEHIKVIEELLGDFQEAISYLEEELSILKEARG